MKKYIMIILASWAVIINSVAGQTIDTLIDVGVYRLYFHIVQGKGMPILFESGAGADVLIL